MNQNIEVAELVARYAALQRKIIAGDDSDDGETQKLSGVTSATGALNIEIGDIWGIAIMCICEIYHWVKVPILSMLRRAPG